MKRYKLLFLILLAITSPPSTSEGMVIGTAEFTSLFDKQAGDRLLLIGFEDQHINRIQSTSSPSSYRRRGTYHNSIWSERITANIEDEYHLQKITEWLMTEVAIHCAVYLVPLNQSVEKTKAKLEQDERVEIVQKMNIFTTRNHKYSDPYYLLQSNLHGMQIDRAHSISTGKNVTITMIDTGVDLNHPDLKGQIIYNKNLVSGISSSFTNDMHGTAIAGVMVARSDNKGITGVAPNAKLIVLKACWPNQANSYAATCNSFTLALAVNTAIKLGANILNMSLTGPHDPLLEKLLNKAMEKGIIVIAADPGSRSVNKRFPASLNNVIAVQTLAISNSKQNQLITAPGENILTTIPHGTYEYTSGSSISAAHISGIVALLLELNSDLTLVEAKNILQNSVLSRNKGVARGISARIAVRQLCEKLSKCPKSF